jgi:uncharacterized RDD family membrane protein YckC
MKIPQNLAIKSFPPAGLLRRFAAILYDSLLLFSVLFFANGLFIVVIPIESSMQLLLQQLYLLMVSFLYFAWSWLRGGQTLGMMAWQIQLQPIEGKQITVWLMVRRFVMAIFSWFLGLGFFWAIWDKEGRTWHDWASETRLVWLRTENNS